MTNNIETTDRTMQGSAAELADAVVGHKIVDVYDGGGAFTITLDSGEKVRILGGGDCCAFTELNAFLLHPDKVDHVITGVTTEDDYQKWHILADMGDVLDLTVGWSEGSGYYSYGFYIEVVPA